MIYRIVLIIAVSILLITSCKEKVNYLDNDFPDLIPKKYAIGTINIKGRFQQNLTMSPDGKEHLFTVTRSKLWRYESILRTRIKGNEILIDTPQFVTNFKYKNQWFIGEPMISLDNQNLYFIADYPPDLWNSKRKNGDWSAPVKMDAISTEKDNWYASISKDNNLYFTNGTLYTSSLEHGNYNSITKVEAPFNQIDIRDTYISPNEDYLIFTSSDSTNNKQSDLFASFKNSQGNWSKAFNLGGNINTEFREFAPYISPDEQYLFFSRRDTWQNAKFSNIYWVSLKVIDKFRKEVN